MSLCKCGKKPDRIKSDCIIEGCAMCGTMKVYSVHEYWNKALETGKGIYRELVDSNIQLINENDNLEKELAQVKAENEELKRFIISWGEEIRSDIEVDNHKQLYLDCIDFETCCRKILKKEQEK